MGGTTGRTGRRQANIRDPALLHGLFQERPIYLVIHLAAMAGVRPSIERPLTYSEVNVQGTLNLLECCRTHHVRQVLFGSSSSVYGARNVSPLPITITPVHQCLPTLPLNVLASYRDTYGTVSWRIARLRFFTVMGPISVPTSLSTSLRG